jgi:hypothetical protein
MMNKCKNCFNLRIRKNNPSSINHSLVFASERKAFCSIFLIIKSLFFNTYLACIKLIAPDLLLLIVCFLVKQLSSGTVASKFLGVESASSIVFCCEFLNSYIGISLSES